MALRDIKIGAATFSRTPAKSKRDTGFTILGVYDYFNKIEKRDLIEILQLPTQIVIPEGVYLQYSYKYRSSKNNKFYLFFINYLGAGDDKYSREGAYYGGAVGMEYEGFILSSKKLSFILDRALELSYKLVSNEIITSKMGQQNTFLKSFKKYIKEKKIDQPGKGDPVILSSPKMLIDTQKFIEIAIEQKVSEKIYYSNSPKVLTGIKNELDESNAWEYDPQKGIKEVISDEENITTDEMELDKKSDLSQDEEDEDDILSVADSEKEDAYVETLAEVLKLNKTIDEKIDGIAKLLKVKTEQNSPPQSKERPKSSDKSAATVSNSFYKNNSIWKRKHVLSILLVLFCICVGIWNISSYYHKSFGTNSRQIEGTYEKIERLKNEVSTLNAQLANVNIREQQRIEKIRNRTFDFDAKNLRIYGLIKSDATSIPPQDLMKSELADMFNVDKLTIRKLAFVRSNTDWFLIPIKGVHNVEKGEMLSDLAKKYYIDTGNSKLIRDFNNIKEGEFLTEGTLLCIPFEKQFRDSEDD